MCKYHKVWKVTTPWKKQPFKSSNRISKLLTKQIPKVPILQKWWRSECSDLKCAQLLWCNINSFKQGFPISSLIFFSLIWIGLHVVHDYLIQPLLNQHHWHLQWPKKFSVTFNNLFFWCPEFFWQNLMFHWQVKGSLHTEVSQIVLFRRKAFYGLYHIWVILIQQVTSTKTWKKTVECAVDSQSQ